jgi:putative PIN family toxin of toxin-antitoxin system
MKVKPEPRVFLDSNVIFSGLYSSGGAPGIILELFMRGKIRVVVSQQVLEEVVRTLKEKLPGALPALKTLLVNTPPEIVKDPLVSEITRWADRLQAGEAAILAAAASAEPDCFISGDSHFIAVPGLAAAAGIEILTPAQFLKSLEDRVL